MYPLLMYKKIGTIYTHIYIHIVLSMRVCVCVYTWLVLCLARVNTSHQNEGLVCWP